MNKLVDVKRLVLFSFLLTLLCIEVPLLRAGELRVHNSTPLFLKFWDEARALPLDEQIALFEKKVWPSFPQFYEYKVSAWAENGTAKRDGFKKVFEDFQEIESRFRTKSAAISVELDSNLKKFLKTFPDFKTNLDAYVIHSFGEMDGGTRLLKGKETLIFGIDGMIKHHNGKSEIPFFHHELFHAYHMQHLNAESAVWSALWVEGLATYISESLNPGSSLQDLLLDLPVGMVERCKKDIPFLWSDLKSKLRSKDGEDYSNYFLMNSKHPKIPPRAGYYLGYLVAKELGKTRTLYELSRLRGKKLESLIFKTIESISR